MDRSLSVPTPQAPTPARGQRIALVDLLDRLLAGGVVITGDVTISIADVDLVRVSLRAVIASIRPEMDRMLETDVTEAGPIQGVVVREDPRP